jgi:hypothetical protein
MGTALFPPGSPPDFLPLEKAPDVMNFFIMVQSLSLCLKGYKWCRQVAWRSFFGWSRLAHEVMFGVHYAILAGVTGFLIAAAIVSYYDDMMGSPRVPFLAALGAFLGTLNGGLGWCGSATISGRVRVT